MVFFFKDEFLTLEINAKPYNALASGAGDCYLRKMVWRRTRPVFGDVIVIDALGDDSQLCENTKSLPRLSNLGRLLFYKRNLLFGYLRTSPELQNSIDQKRSG